MSKRYKLCGCILTVIFGTSCSSMATIQQPMNSYLDAAKACYGANGVNEATGDKLRDHVSYLLSNTESKDYIGHHERRSGDITVIYRKTLKLIDFTISLSVHSGKSGCDQFSVYEIVP